MTRERPLHELVSVRGRFARSVRLDKDAGHVEQLDGYLPTGRSLEVVRRLVQAMEKPEGTRAFSITGPYGSGKSSLALFIDALLGHENDAAHQKALELLQEYEPQTAEHLDGARRALGAGPSGFIRAVITAPQREPITTTVLRALERGAQRARASKQIRTELADALGRAESERYASPSHREIRKLIEGLTGSGSKKPLLLVVDEFGKNLEAYADSGREGDLYLLQELAEWATGQDALPLVLVTIQHLAFEAYAKDATTAKRREWAKVQGRFEDIPFVDSAAATRTLIAAALSHEDDPAYEQWRHDAAEEEAAEAERRGLPAVADPETVAACYPLHPSTLLVLPELCTRYGQNERTLFSFLASDEPRSVLSFARTAEASPQLPWVRLDQVYDYFVESASTFVGASRDASRWIEVETTIRDAHGLTEAQRRVLKTIGVLNLVAAGGALRASHEFLTYALADARPGTASESEVADRLRELEKSGLIVFRDFASEYRVWQGSDFDLTGTLRSARRHVRQTSLAALLEEIQPMPPLVAARHTIKTGTVRAFARAYADRRTALPDLDRRHDKGDGRSYRKLHGCDGLLLYVVDSDGQLPELRLPTNDLPVITVVPNDPVPLIEAAVEVAALLEVAEDPNLSADDRAAHRELIERTAYARQVLDHTVAETFTDKATWTWHNPINKDGSQPKKRGPREMRSRHGTSGLSHVFDRVFAESPVVHYETINRTELTSQGAKARRILLEAALDPDRRLRDRLGLEGEGPDVAIYHALLAEPGIHEAGQGFKLPSSADWKPAWNALVSCLRSSTEAPISVPHILRTLEAPPYGLKDGTATVLLTLGLVVHASEIAIYEHGTFRPRLDAPLSERMVRNPENFAIKHLAVGPKSKRYQALEALASSLGKALPRLGTAQNAASNPTVLTVTLALVDILHKHTDDFTRKTKRFQGLWDASVPKPVMERACAVRDALLETHEPDVLLFERLPAAVGFGALPASGKGADAMTEDEVTEFAKQIAEAASVINNAERLLAEHVTHVICDAADCNTLTEVISKANDLTDLDVLAPPVKRFADIARMFEAYTDVSAWIGAVTEAVCGGSLRHWTDHTAPAHLEHLRQTVSDYSRVADLARFTAGRTDKAFRAFQIHATDQAGQSDRGIVSVREEAMSSAAAMLEESAAQLASELDGGIDAAQEALLAVLIERFLSRGESAAIQESETQHPTEEGAASQ